LRRFPFFLRRLLHLDPMLIQASEKEDLFSLAPPRARHHIADDHLVSVTQMGLSVHVVDRGCDVKRFAHAPAHVAAPLAKRKMQNMISA